MDSQVKDCQESLPGQCAAVEQQVVNCEAMNPDAGAASSCIQGILSTAMANGLSVFHIHKAAYGVGRQIHAKIDKGNVKNSDVGK